MMTKFFLTFFIINIINAHLYFNPLYSQDNHQNNPNTISLKEIHGINIIDDKLINLKLNSRSLYTIFYFLSSTCPCSQSHFDHLNQLKEDYPQFEFIAFHSHKKISSKEAKTYYQKFKIDFPIISDQSLQFANIFGALKTPHVYILNKKNAVIYQGGVTNSVNPENATKFHLKEVLKNLSQGNKIKVDQTKTIGCYIQR